MGSARSRHSQPTMGHRMPLRHSSLPVKEAARAAGATAPSVGRLAPSTIQRAQHDPSSLSPTNVMRLQSTLGNSAVSAMIGPAMMGRGMIDPSMTVPGMTVPGMMNTGDPSAPFLQTKLMVGEGDDAYEQEADSVARDVVGKIHGKEAASSLSKAPSMSEPPVQRQPEKGEEPGEQATSSAAPVEGGEVEPELAGEIQQARGGGKLLEKPVRSAMEGAFGADFSGVRVHQTPAADSINRSINARAFTTGQDLFFRQGSYNPHTVAGQGLLAHELTHVVQQGAATQTMQRQQSAPEDRLPSAQSVARSSRSLGQSTQVAQRAGTGRIHRCTENKKKKSGAKPIEKEPEEKRRSITLDQDEGQNEVGSSGGDKGKEPIITPVIDEEGPPLIVKKTTGTKPPKKKVPSEESHSEEDSGEKNLKSSGSKPVDSTSDIKMTGPKPTSSAPVMSVVGDRDTSTAKGIITSSGMDVDYKLRALELINDPNKSSQAGYGICGLTSVLRAIIIADPDRFATLAVQAASDVETVDKWHDFFQANADEEQQEEQKELDFILAQWLLHKSTKGMVSQTVLKRKPQGGYSSVTKTKDYSEVKQDQENFSNTFKMQDWEEDGHYATTAGGLNYLYTSLTGKKGYKIKVTDFGKDYARAKSKAGAKGTVNAAIMGHDFYKAKGKRVRKPPKEAHPAKYRHWVTILNSKRINVKDRRSGNVSKYFKMKIWTYENFWDAKVREDMVGTYIHSLLVM